MRTLPFLLVLPLFVIGSCRLLGVSDAWKDVQGVSWRLVSIEGSAPLAEVEVRLQFDDGGRLFGELGKRPYFGSYARTGRSGLSVGKIGWARSPHPSDATRQEERFLALLAAADSFAVDPHGLSLSQQGSATLAFVPEK